MPNLADRESQNLRAAAYRTLRYLCNDPGDIGQLISNGLELFLVKSFSRNASFELEKIQAVLLVRSWYSYLQKNTAVLPIGIVRAIVALSENSDEKLRFLALESLAELVLYDTNLLIQSEGLRVVLQAFVEGPYELPPYLALAFLPIMDLPRTRSLLRPGLDIEVNVKRIRLKPLILYECQQLVISSFTIVSSKSTSAIQDEKLRTCACIVGMYLKSWAGKYRFLRTNFFGFFVCN